MSIKLFFSNLLGGAKTEPKVEIVIFDSQRPARPLKNSVSAIQKYIEMAFSGLGYYAMMQKEETRAIGSVQMWEEINWIIDKAKEHQSDVLYMSAAHLLSLYTSWYRHINKGEDKTEPLSLLITLIESATRINPGEPSHKIWMAEYLTYRPQIRNIGKARELLENIGFNNKRIQTILDDIDKQQGTLTFDPNFKYHELTFIPTNELTHERVKCRTLIKQFKKEKKLEDLKSVLDHFYRIAVIYEIGLYCHGLSYKNKEESEKNFKKLKAIVLNMVLYSYPEHGRLRNSSFVSDNDYKTFEKFFGQQTKSFDPVGLLTTL